jgi:adenylate cyclase
MANIDNEGERLAQVLCRHMSAELAEQLLEGMEALETEESESERHREITILYIHAHNSDDVVAQLNPEASVEVLNDYLEGAVSAIFECKGTLDKYIGADILAVFGSPLSLKDHAWMAAQAALEIDQRVQNLQRMSTLAGQLSISVSIGMHSGQVFMVGTNHINSAVMDVINKDVINQAVRLSKLGQTYNCSILMTESTRSLLNDQLPTREIGTASLALKDNATKIYQLVSDSI